jgi:hypothetical protein
MAHLVVNHVEEQDADYKRRIAEEIERTLQNKEIVYLNPYYTGSDLKDLLPATPDKNMIVMECFVDKEEFDGLKMGSERVLFEATYCQQLNLKSRLIGDEIASVNLAGVYLYSCISEIYTLLTGHPTLPSQRDIQVEAGGKYKRYHIAAAKLGIDDDALFKILVKPISCNILYSLCKSR